MANLGGASNIITGQPVPEADVPSPYWPDVNVDTAPVTLSMTYAVAIPDNFDDLPPEEQEILKAQYRFGGIPCRSDLGGTVPITRETLDVP